MKYGMFLTMMLGFMVSSAYLHADEKNDPHDGTWLAGS